MRLLPGIMEPTYSAVSIPVRGRECVVEHSKNPSEDRIVSIPVRGRECV